MSKNAICFHTRKSQNLFEIKTFPSLSKTKTLKKKEKDGMPFVSATHSSVVGLQIYTLVIQ